MDIALQIEFLGTPQLADPSTKSQFGEWPPAPDRVFQALVATAAETGQDMNVLRHLEFAPEIAASKALLARAPKRYLPENFRRSTRYHQGAAKYLPTVLPESPLVSYIWRQVPDAIAPPLRAIAEQLTHVGRAASLVRGALVDANNVQSIWLPSPDSQGERYLRTPYPGRLDDLQNSYRAGFWPSQAPSVAYRAADSVIPKSEWGRLMVLQPKEGQLAMEQAIYWCSALRTAIMSNAPKPIPAFIHGHDEYRHLAWAALPDVGHPYASGNILGLGCWLPADISPEEQGLIGSLMMQLTHGHVKKLSVQIATEESKGLQAATWTAPSRNWATAIPIALGHWPKRTYPAEAIVRRSLIALGYPPPEQVECGNLSPFKGAIHARKFTSRKGGHFITHAVFSWKQPVAGPILIGADRYFGGGLCRPLASGRNGYGC